MGAVKSWAMDLTYEMFDAGYSIEEIAAELECDISFVKAVLGVD